MKNQSRKQVTEHMLKLADMTQTCIIQGNLMQARKYMQEAEELLTNGDALLRNAVGVYIESVSQFLESHNHHAPDLLPETLRTAVKSQIYKPGT
jgi:hypothetical protein